MCHVCTDNNKRRRGCRIQGRSIKRESAPVRWCSPALQAKADELSECPTSYLAREAPWVWDAIEASTMVERMGPDAWASAPRALRTAARIYSSEMERARQINEKRKRSKAASEYGQRAVSRG
jgi:hypothetical protein